MGLVMFSFVNLFSQGTTTLTINSLQPVGDYIARDKIIALPGSKFVASGGGQSHLYLDKNIIAPIDVNGNPYVSYNVNSVYTIDKNLPVGFVQGSGGVSTGHSYYSIPIPIAPGTAGMVPNIGISYNSSQIGGLVGNGWGISGISTISRVQDDKYHRINVKPIGLISTDLFALDGNILWGNNPDGSKRLENDNYTDVSEVGNYTSFLVTTKEGMVMEYGATSDSKLMVKNSADIDIPLVYYMNKVTDKYGNYYTYHYYNQKGEVALKEIKYTGTVNFTPYNSIKFYYDSRDDQGAKYFKGNEIQTTLILREVEVFCETQSIKKIVPTYNLIDGKSYLTSITEYGLDNSHLNPTKFAYELPIATTNANVTQLPALADYKVADFNGDGKSDVLAYLYNSVDVGSGLRTYYSWELYINQNDGTTYSLVDSYQGTGPFQAYSYYGIPNSFSPEAEGTTAINLDGDEKEDALFLTSAGGITSYSVQISNGNGFTPGYIFNLPTGANIIFADIDGDKIPEGIAYHAANNNLYIVNFKTRLIQVKNIAGIFFDANPIFNTGTSGTFNIIQTIDYDGDGIQELLVERNSKWRVAKIGQYSAINSAGGSNFVLDVLATDDIFNLSTTGCYSYENLYADFNGDGLTDNLTVGTDPTAAVPITMPPTPSTACPLSVPNNFFLRYNINKFDNSNSSFYKYPTSSMAGNIPGRNNVNSKLLLADMNNDGSTDLVTLQKNASFNSVKVYVSYAPNFSNKVLIGTLSNTNFPDAINYNYYTATPYSGYGNNISEFSLGDFDGDGYTDIMFKNTNKIPLTDLNAGERTIFYNHPVSTEGKLAQVTNGFDQTIKFNYQTLAKGGIYIKGSGASYPFVDMQSPIKVVSSMESQDANGNFYSTDYTYEGAKISQFGQGFLGYDKISVINNLMQTKTISTNSFNTYLSTIVLPSSITQTISAFAYRTPINSKTYLLSNLGSPISETQNTFSYIHSNGPVLPSLNVGIGHYLKLDQTINYDNVHGTNSTTDFTYDAYHNLITSHSLTNGGVISDIVNTMDPILYGNKYPTHIFTTKVDVTRQGQNTISRTAGYAYLTNGLLRQLAENVGQNCADFTDYVYNTIGIPSSVKKSDNYNSARTIILDYDAKFRFVTKTTNPLSHISQAIYDSRFGVPLQTTDITNLSTNYTYDAYGRNLAITTPDNNTINYTTKWYDSSDDISGDPFPASNILITTQVNAPNSPFSRSFHTATGLDVKSVTEGFNQNFISNRAIYTNKGQLDEAKATYLIPCINPSQVLTSNNTYDNLNRPTSSSIYDGTTILNTTIAYSQSGVNNTEVVTTPDNKIKTTITDLSGSVKMVIDNANNLLSYDYFSDGNLKSTALNGVTTNSFDYDPCGNIKTQDEPNNGITAFTFDGFGQMKTRTNDSKTYTYNYDILGRPSSFAGPEGTYLFSYITSGAGLENLESETAPNGTKNKFYYDALNRPNKVEETVGSTYTTLLDYDQYSNPIKYTYPSGFAIKMAYDNLGYPTTIKNNTNNRLIWQADEINSFGEYNQFTLGNNIQTINTYNNFGMLLNTSSSNAFDHTYDFDITTGNLMSLTDNLKNLKETHQYDYLDRLTNSTVTDLFTQVNLPALTLTYDPNGNITNKSDVGDYKYMGTKPNAVQFVRNQNNVISQLQQDVTYTAFEKAESLIEGNEQAIITYGPSQERVKTDFLNISSGATSSRYYLNNYDKEVKTGMTREVHYINAPSGLAAMHVIENGVGTTYFTYSDHLGTPKTLTNNNGTIVAEQNFDPWGQRRNPNTLDYSSVPTPPDWLFRGYTGHEHLPQFSLINMNGRMYDPQNARMLSTDPHLQDPGNSQNHNRYSYCINNPLKYTDPSGYEFSFSTKNADVYFGGGSFGGGGFNSPGVGGATSSDVDLSINRHLYNNPNHGGLSPQEEALYYNNRGKLAGGNDGTQSMALLINSQEGGWRVSEKEVDMFAAQNVRGLEGYNVKIGTRKEIYYNHTRISLAGGGDDPKKKAATAPVIGVGIRIGAPIISSEIAIGFLARASLITLPLTMTGDSPLGKHKDSERTYFHYTTAANLAGIIQTKAIFPNAKNKVYLTPFALSPIAATYKLFLNQPTHKGKEAFFIEFKISQFDEQRLNFDPTQPFELYNTGTLRIRKIVSYGPNLFKTN